MAISQGKKDKEEDHERAPTAPASTPVREVLVPRAYVLGNGDPAAAAVHLEGQPLCPSSSIV